MKVSWELWSISCGHFKMNWSFLWLYFKPPKIEWWVFLFWNEDLNSRSRTSRLSRSSTTLRPLIVQLHQHLTLDWQSFPYRLIIMRNLINAQALTPQSMMSLWWNLCTAFDTNFLDIEMKIKSPAHSLLQHSVTHRLLWTLLKASRAQHLSWRSYF